MTRLRLMSLTLLVLVAWLPALSAPGAPQEMGGDEGPAVCADCHEEQVLSTARGPHSALDTMGLAADAGHMNSCAACHGDPTQHLEEGGGAETMHAFGAGENARAQMEVCLTCHSTTHPRFLAGPHAQAGIGCIDCHSVHSGNPGDTLLKVDTDRAQTQDPFANVSTASLSCAGCHEDVFTHFEFNERHRLREGIIGCEDCHNPHGTTARAQLGGFNQEQCVDCHADKGGPWVFEHGAQRVEGCVACHSPHGSPNRHLLNFQNVAELCFSCHAVVPGFHSRFTLETRCTNCHSTIHGSNFDPAFLQ